MIAIGLSARNKTSLLIEEVDFKGYLEVNVIELETHTVNQ